jgi:peroxiredoxin
VELPRLELLWQKYRDQGFAVLAIESRHATEKALEFITESKLTYHLVEDHEEGERILGDKLGVFAFPTSYLVDRQGRIMFSHLGFQEGDEEKLEAEIKKLLEL